MSPNDEYGVYERIAVLETKLAELERRPAPSVGFLGIPSPIVVWAVLAATAMGSGPEVLDLLTKVILK